jgi:L-methionine (R)-S-oxide reductase
MAESLPYQPELLSKPEKYKACLSYLSALAPENSRRSHALAFLAMAMATLKETFQWWWVGLYLDDGVELVLGPYIGPLPCISIAYERGVCGRAFTNNEVLNVPDVESFPGHIACSSASRSELVLPIASEGRKLAVLDVDSEWLAHFDDVDIEGLSAILPILGKSIAILDMRGAAN